MGCAARVRGILEQIDGVDRVDISFAAKTAMVTMRPGKSLSKTRCEAAFQNTPYGVASYEPAPSSAAPTDSGI